MHRWRSIFALAVILGFCGAMQAGGVAAREDRQDRSPQSAPGARPKLVSINIEGIGAERARIYLTTDTGERSELDGSVFGVETTEDGLKITANEKVTIRRPAAKQVTTASSMELLVSRDGTYVVRLKGTLRTHGGR